MALGTLTAMLGCKQSYQRALEALPTEGDALPAFTLPLLSGDSIDSAELRGQTVIVALWSTTCGASRLALESMSALNAEYAAHGVRLLVLADDAEPTSVQYVLDSAGVQLEVALAAGKISSILAPSSRGVWTSGVALPSFLVMDRSGVVRHRVIGVEQDPVPRMDRVRMAVDRVLVTQMPRRAE